jgi:hypothetical protein
VNLDHNFAVGISISHLAGLLRLGSWTAWDLPDGGIPLNLWKGQKQIEKERKAKNAARRLREENYEVPSDNEDSDSDSEYYISASLESSSTKKNSTLKSTDSSRSTEEMKVQEIPHF